MKSSLLKFSVLIILSGLTVISCTKRVEIDRIREKFVNDLIAKMTLEEKIGQMTLYTSGWDVTGPTLNENYRKDILAGRCGNLFNAHTVAYNMELQKLTVEQTRLKIPLLFGYDVIHGFKTIFPIPLAESCSWDLELIGKSARMAAKEAASAGLNWTFAPMVDIARDPRWGRVAEGAGEDPYLGSLIAAARTRGFQGSKLSDPFTLAACVKHFAAYGAAEGGRDYNTVDMSERTLREIYLPPYHAAIKAGAATVMSSFNELFGSPATGSRFLLYQVLRKEWGFPGVVVTDYTSINEMVKHGFSIDEKQAGEQALSAGVDMDMQGGVYQNYLFESVGQGKITESQIDQAVGRILYLKYDLGLFEDPYRYLDLKREKENTLSVEMLAHSLDIAQKSIVLLRNEPFKEEVLLPLSAGVRKIAIIGPLANDQVNMLGTWHAAGDAGRVVTVLEGLKSALPGSQISFSKGCETFGEERYGFQDAVSKAANSDLVIIALGENWEQSGEAASRSVLGLPGVQQELLEKILATGKPVVVLLMAGRPLVIPWMVQHVPAILNTSHLGTCAGSAIANVLTGKYNPSGKLTMSFPRNEGQIPVYYATKNTGRPLDAANKYTTKYLDIPNEPLFPFGFGLSYTNFKYSDLTLSSSTISATDTLLVRVTVSNTGTVDGEEVVQLYVRDLVGSVTRPVKELKGFKKLMFKAGESQQVTFKLSTDDLRFYTADLTFAAEPGMFRVMVGTSSVEYLENGFELLK
ncbi:MAG: glycoside hydrolase family 3 N-terminal domain-containing protein [Bacteroidales bacterium]|jgi:beta-glucosidase